jgi:hypothetical protein
MIDRDQRCSCTKTETDHCCHNQFETWEIVKLRTERLSMTLKEQTSRRNHDIVMGYGNLAQSTKCMPMLSNRRVCLKGYCIVMGWNYNWVCTGLKGLRKRSHENSHYAVQPHVRFRRKAVFTEECKSWIRGWIQVTGDHDPTGEQQSYSINFVDIGQLHKIYVNEMRKSDMEVTARVASLRTFRREFQDICKEERVRIRKKINTSTKCKGL